MDTTRPADLSKLAELIKDVRVAMMLTFPPNVAAGEIPVSARPMYTQKLDPVAFDGELWFFTDSTCGKVEELRRNPAVLLTYAAPDKNRFVAVSGTAVCEHNEAKAKELWNIHAKGWWPDGPESPSLVLIRVQVRSAEYWDGPSNTSYMLSLLKAVATGERIQTGGEHGSVGKPLPDRQCATTGMRERSEDKYLA